MVLAVLRYLLVVILLNIQYFSGYCDEVSDPVVTIEQGSLKGKIQSGVNGQKYYSYQGIPYAEPPIGELRFQAPKLPKSWEGVLDATKERDECYATHMLLPYRVGSEDCLHVNVYTPKDPQNVEDALLPVMVWVHGGGFTSGSSKTEIYGPEYIIYHNVVFVSFNYRLGCLGFLSLENSSLGVPGNTGIKDQILALQWVQKNIAAFGGNPNDVTIFGESAGAAAVHLLVVSPAAKGLFHKAIMESGCMLNFWTRGTRYAKQLAENLGLESDDEEQILKLLREVPVKDLIDAQEAIKQSIIRSGPSLTGIVIENPSSDEPNVLIEEPIDIIRSGNYNKVPILMGYNSLEGILAEISLGDALEANFESQVPQELGLEEGSDEFKEVAQRIKEFYYGDAEPTKENLNNYLELLTDSIYSYGIQIAVKNHATTSTALVYLYKFSVDADLNLFKKLSGNKRPGACHADEIGYLFKTEVLNNTFPEGTVEDITIKRMTTLWTNFAKYGDPNPADGDELIDVVWERVKSDKEVNYLEIDEELFTGVNLDADRIAFWESIYNFKNSTL